jgi:uncharacterized protein YutE (UPF0331/DUF86 family)
MPPEFSGIERRLDELNERLARLEPLREKKQTAFDEDPYLRDIVERNLEVAAQCCIDICNRIIVLEEAPKPQDYYEAIRRQGELGVLPPEFARSLAPLAGFRNVLAHQYLSVDWDKVYTPLHRIDELRTCLADCLRPATSWISLHEATALAR